MTRIAVRYKNHHKNAVRASRPASLEMLLAVTNYTALAERFHLAQDAVTGIIRSLFEGSRMTHTAAHHQVSYYVVYQIALAIAWNKTWTNRSPKLPTIVGLLPAHVVVERLQALEPMESIARDAGLSRERIRQVGDLFQLTPRRAVLRSVSAMARDVKIKQNATERINRQHIKILKRIEEEIAFKAHMALANQLWNQNYTIAYIAAVYKLTSNSMGWTIHRARNLGPEWFPHRQKHQIKRTPQQVRPLKI